MHAASNHEIVDPGEQRAGLAFALAANMVWGLMPVYFVALGDVPRLEVLAHRIIWSALLLFGLCLARRRRTPAPVRPRQRSMSFVLVVTAFLLGAEWLTCVHAVASRQILQASLGYFLAPLFTMLLSVIFLRDRLSAAQSGAIGL